MPDEPEGQDEMVVEPPEADPQEDVASLSEDDEAYGEEPVV